MDIECTHCHALHWQEEQISGSSTAAPKFGGCCQHGQVTLESLPDPPEPLKSYLTGNDPDSTHFRENIWKYNRALAFTSLGVREDWSINGRGPPVFRVSGELHHYIGALDPQPGRLPRYAQLYVVEPQRALHARTVQNPTLARTVLESLQTMLLSSHAYAPLYTQAYEILQQYDPSNDITVTLRLQPGIDGRRYNLPTAEEIAVILPGVGDPLPRDIVLRRRHERGLDRISELHPGYAALQYPLLLPHGTHQWHPGLTLEQSAEQQASRASAGRKRKAQRRERDGEDDEGDDDDGEAHLNGDRRLTLSRYVAYRIHMRPGETNTFLQGGSLFQRFIVDMYAAVDQSRLRYILLNQNIFRAARFNNLQDAAAHEPDNLDLDELGERVFLPSSYTGGPRNMTQGFQDSMALARFFKKVDLFVTMTTNPQWPEIERELLPGQTSYDRPDLVSRVFRMKQKALVDDVHKHGIFGITVAYVYTIEFQKRGLPHMHILIFLKDRHKLLTPEAIDSCISAQWPDPAAHPLLFETVQTCMVHGPCGAMNPHAPCMVSGVCSKKFPKPFQDVTVLGEGGYPLYARPNDGRAYNVKGVWMDNRWIVPYCPYLSTKFNCHINVECAVSLASMAYTFKYIQKGPDRGAIELANKDEIKAWQDGRYISAPDAVHRLLQYPIHHQTPNVVRLAIHLPDHHMVFYREGANLEQVLQQGRNKKTSLTAFFAANADPGELGEQARAMTYQEFPQRLRFCASSAKWTIRKQGFALGRMYFIKPSAGELFYLRTLLTVVKGEFIANDHMGLAQSDTTFPVY